MADREESIYNLIPRVSNEEVKPERRSHKSRTTVPDKHAKAAPIRSNKTGVMGTPPGTAAPSTKHFLKKKSKDIPEGVSRPGTKVAKFKRHGERKPAIPKKSEAPITGLRSETNFIVQNAVDSITTAPKHKTEEDPNWMKKEGFGQPPEYLRQVKEEVAQEYEYIRKMQEDEVEQIERATGVRELSEEEKVEILSVLREKFTNLQRVYGAMPMAIDTENKKRRKEQLEAELAQLEKDIEKMSRKRVFVELDDAEMAK